MSLTALATSQEQSWSPILEDFELEDNSPFGLQGLARNTLQIIKPNCITRLAITLALRATREQIRDRDYVNRVLSWHPEWVDEYQVVHLIERSLWIQGHSDLVMTMIRNPSQIPDNPPPKIREALSRAYMLHPDATVWYGVPLFGTETNSEGLPIPVTASEVRAEADRRMEAAQQHALRWGWMYRAALTAARIPSMCWHAGVLARQRLQRAVEGMKSYWQKARKDARLRARAIYQAELEHCRYGCSHTAIPEHTTVLGRSLESACVFMELVIYEASIVGRASPFLGLMATPIAIAKFVPMLIVPMTMVSVDPFLFVELPEEPGKLRHLGHWYWQQKPLGRKKLHLHLHLHV